MSGDGVLARLEALEQAATSGPWETRGVSVRAVREGVSGGVPLANVYQDEVDAELIAEVRNALPALLNIARAAEAYVGALKAYRYPNPELGALAAALAGLDGSE